MPHIHIALVGGQPSPVLSVIKAVKPDGVALICSTVTKDKAKYVESQAGCKCAISIIDATDAKEIKSAFENVRDIFAGNTLSVNISGGTKAWSFYAYTVFSQIPGTKFFYIDQQNTLWDLNEATGEKVEKYDTWYDQTIKSTPLEVFNDEDDAAVAQIEKLRQNNYLAFNYLTIPRKPQLPPRWENDWARDNVEDKSSRKGICSFDWNCESGTLTANFQHESSKGTSLLSEEIKSPNIRLLLFNTAWFEFKVARLISQWPEAKNIRLNNVLKSSGDTANELDVVFEALGRTFFVEVKTQIFNTTDIDKFNSVVDRVGGTAALKLFVTEASVNQTAKSKFDAYGITSFALKDRGKDDIVPDFIATLEELSQKSNS